MKKLLVLLAIIVAPVGAHAVESVQVYCPGYTCGTYADFCDSSYKWCGGVVPGNNSTYKYCVPEFGYYTNNTTNESYPSSSRGIVCYANQAKCQAIAQQTVPFVWDGTSTYMHPENGYFYDGCGTTAKYAQTSSTSTSELSAPAPGYYMSARYPLLKEDDTGSWIDDHVSSCAAGTYSRGVARECTSVPSNSTASSDKSNFVCNSGYYGQDTHTPGTGIGGSCTLCPTPDSGWTRASESPTTAYLSCYEYQTPTGCSSGTVRRWASSTSAYSSTVQLGSTLTASTGYYTTGSSATSCTRCPAQGGVYGTTTGGATGVDDCYMGTSSTLTNTIGSYQFTSACYYCTNICSTNSECNSAGYGSCSNGCCTNACSSGYGCANALECQSHNYAQCSGGCCTQPCPSGVYGNLFLCQNQNYGESTNNCCSNSCGTKGTCTSGSDCYSNGYKTCSGGCCSGTKCPSGSACSTDSDCPSGYPTCSSGCCVASSSCAKPCIDGSCTTYGTNYSCNLSTNCCVKQTGSACLPAQNTCNAVADCYGGGVQTIDCICTCTNNRCSCAEGVRPIDKE